MKKFLMLSLVLGVVIFGFTGLGYADLNDGLVAYYPFNGNANDESGNGNHGTASGEAILTSDRFGNADSAYFFPGKGSYIELPLIFSEARDPLTISSWVNYSSLTTISCIYGEFNDLTGGRNHFFVHPSSLYVGDKDRFGFDHYPPSGGVAYVDVDLVSEINKWVHLAMVKDSGVVYFYKNGLLVGSAPHTETWYDNNQASNKSRLGEADVPNEANRAMHGKMDDVRIYDRALSQTEVKELAEVTLETRLVAYYPFNGNANDESGNGHDGVERGGLVYEPGVYRQAVSLDGVDDYVLSDTASSIFTGYDEVAIAAWIKTTSHVTNHTDYRGQIWNCWYNNSSTQVML